MDSKFYVSLEAARLLKEKGYNEEVELFYNTLGELMNVSDMFCCEVADNTQMTKYGYLSAPSKDEAIDWLDNKGITIEIHWIRFNENRIWNYSIFNCSTCDTIDTKYIFQNRLAAKNAAIIKALKLL